MTSAYMLAGEGMTSSNQQEVLDRIAHSVINNMLSSHYFTYFYLNQEPIKYKRVDDAVLTLNGAKLTMHFELLIAKPININQQGIRLLIFDPTYYVDMSWDNPGDVQLAYAGTCQLNVIEPNPTPEQVTYALSLGPDESPDNDLGQLFTQSAEIHCN